MNKILGIDISPFSVNAVVVEQRLNRRRIAACHSVPRAGGGSISEALKEAAAAVGGFGLPCISAVSAREISFHSLSMPFSSLSKIRQVIAFELESRLLTPLGDVQFDLYLVRRLADQSTVLTAALTRSALDNIIAGFHANHLDLITVEVRNHALATQMLRCPGGHETILLLDVEDSVLTLCHQGTVVLHRPLRQGMSGAGRAPSSDPAAFAAHAHAFLTGVLTTLHAYGVENGIDLNPTRVMLTGAGSEDKTLAGLVAARFPGAIAALDLAAELGIGCRPEDNSQWRPQTMNTALALALRDGRGKNGFNFLSGDYQRTRSGLPYSKELRKGIMWSSLIMMLLVLQQGLEYRQLTRRYHELDHQSRQIFHRVFPAAQLKVDPLLQMQAKMKETRQANGSGIKVSNVMIIDLLQDISARTSLAWKVQVVSLVVDADTIQIKGTTDNFNTVDALKQELAGSPNFKDVTISSATLDRQNSIAFELRLRKAL